MIAKLTDSLRLLFVSSILQIACKNLRRNFHIYLTHVHGSATHTLHHGLATAFDVGQTKITDLNEHNKTTNVINIRRPL